MIKRQTIKPIALCVIALILAPYIACVNDKTQAIEGKYLDGAQVAKEPLILPAATDKALIVPVNSAGVSFGALFWFTLEIPAYSYATIKIAPSDGGPDMRLYSNPTGDFATGDNSWVGTGYEAIQDDIINDWQNTAIEYRTHDIPMRVYLRIHYEKGGVVPAPAPGVFSFIPILRFDYVIEGAPPPAHSEPANDSATGAGLITAYSWGEFDSAADIDWWYLELPASSGARILMDSAHDATPGGNPVPADGGDLPIRYTVYEKAGYDAASQDGDPAPAAELAGAFVYRIDTPLQVEGPCVYNPATTPRQWYLRLELDRAMESMEYFLKNTQTVVTCE